MPHRRAPVSHRHVGAAARDDRRRSATVPLAPRSHQAHRRASGSTVALHRVAQRAATSRFRSRPSANGTTALRRRSHASSAQRCSPGVTRRRIRARQSQHAARNPRPARGPQRSGRRHPASTTRPAVCRPPHALCECLPADCAPVPRQTGSAYPPAHTTVLLRDTAIAAPDAGPLIDRVAFHGSRRGQSPDHQAETAIHLAHRATHRSVGRAAGAYGRAGDTTHGPSACVIRPRWYAESTCPCGASSGASERDRLRLLRRAVVRAARTGDFQDAGLVVRVPLPI